MRKRCGTQKVGGLAKSGDLTLQVNVERKRFLGHRRTRLSQPSSARSAVDRTSARTSRFEFGSVGYRALNMSFVLMLISDSRQS